MYQCVICFITGQLIPNYLSIQYYNPKQVILVATRPMHDRIENIAQTLDKWRNSNLEEIVEVKLNATGTDYTKFLAEIQSKLKEYLNPNCVINATGGTGIMTLAINQIARDHNAPICYVDKNSIQEINLNNNHQQLYQITYRMGLAEYFNLYGYTYQASQATSSNQKSYLNEFVAIYDKVTYSNFHQQTQQTLKGFL